MAGRDESLHQDPHSKKSNTFFPDPFFLKNTRVYCLNTGAPIRVKVVVNV
jgi:hypothetical protein